MPVRVGMISLGCAKNLVDAEIMLGSLLKEGAEITNDAATADVVIVNTCSFIDAAQEESVDAILESAALRDARNRGQGLIVSGCLPQRFREELPKLLPEVDAFMGVDQVADVGQIVQQALKRREQRLSEPERNRRTKQKIVEDLAATAGSGLHAERDVNSGAEKDVSLRGTDRFGKTRTVVMPPGNTVPNSPLVTVHSRPTYVPDFATPRFRLTPQHYAYVKIAEGCNHPCSFCTIPRMRGAHRSRPQHDVVREAEQLIAEGVKELNLISQDSTYYGLDLRPDRTGSIASPDRFNAAARALPEDATTLCTLVRALNDLRGDFWIRLLYTHPAHWTDELIRTIADCPKVARYVDMPLQHIHPNMLERMRRETSGEYIADLIRRIRAGIPGISIRTTFIVGFPGETDAYFDALVEFVRETKFERLGVFTYSQEEGTRAGKMMGQISDAVKQRRRKILMAEQLKVAQSLGQAQVGREARVLVESRWNGKSMRQADVFANVERGSGERGRVDRQKRGKGSITASGTVGDEPIFVARGEADAPDIDGRVYVRGDVALGEFVPVRIIGHSDYDLAAEPA